MKNNINEIIIGIIWIGIFCILAYVAWNHPCSLPANSISANQLKECLTK